MVKIKTNSLLCATFWIMKKYPQIKRIDQICLLKVCTHMEADTVHALMERKGKRQLI